MKKIYIIIVCLLLSGLSRAQNYELGLIHTAGYSFKIVAIPDFDSSGDTDISDIGFAVMLPEGMDDVTSQMSILAGRNWNVTEFDAAFLTGQGLGDGTKDAFQFNMPAGQSLVTHTSGEQIDLVSFEISNMPTSGEMSFLLNSDPIATGAGGVLDSFYNSNIDNTTTQDYFSGIAPGLDSFMFDTLGIETLNSPNFELRIYPNPSIDFINIVANVQFQELGIIDLNGKQVLKSKFTSRLKIDHLESGVYFLQLRSDDFIQIKRLIIQ